MLVYAPDSFWLPTLVPETRASGLACAEATNGEPPEVASVMVMHLNVAVLVQYVPLADSARVPRSSGFAAVYGVLIDSVPGGIVPLMVCVSVQPVCGCVAHGDQAGDASAAPALLALRTDPAVTLRQE